MRLLPCLVVLAALGPVLAPTAGAVAADTRPTPGMTTVPEVFPDPQITTPVQDLVFTESNLDGSLISVGGTKFRLDADVLFAFDKADLTPKARAVLADLAARLAAARARVVRVDGYTDSTGDAVYNRDLSRRRAEAVRREVRARLGAGVSVRASGHGEEDPIADNATEAGRALNRRVSVTVEK